MTGPLSGEVSSFIRRMANALAEQLRGQPVAIAYAIWSLPLLLTLAWLVPPWTNTDEPFHMLRGVSLAHGHIIGSRFDNHSKTAPLGSGGLSDQAIFEAFTGLAKLSWLPNQPNGQVSRTILQRSNDVKWHRGLVLSWFGSTAQYPPPFYVPDILGYWLGRVAHLRVNDTLRLSRCMNALFFLALATTAIARACRFQLLLTAILMLPMTISLAASANQDAGMIGTTALVVAELDRLAFKEKPATRRHAYFILAALVCIASARPPYIALLIILLDLKPGKVGRRYATAGVGAVLAWCLLVAIYVMRPPGGANPAAQIGALMANPGSIFTIIANTIYLSAGTYAWEFVGRLAWNDVPLPPFYLALAGISLAICALASMAGRRISGRNVVIGSLLATVGIFCLLFLDWTTPGADHVEGVTGRYFIPIALFLGLALPNWPCSMKVKPAARYILLILGATTPVVMLTHIVSHFYLAPN